MTERHSRLSSRNLVTVTLSTCALCLALGTARLAAQQSPWESAAARLQQTFTGPLARSFALVAIVVGGILFMFGEASAKRTVAGIIFGGGLALGAVNFVAWLFPTAAP